MKNILILIVCLILVSCQKHNAYNFSYPYDNNNMTESSVKTNYNLFTEKFNDYRPNKKRVRKFMDGLILNPSFEEYWDKPEDRYVSLDNMDSNIERGVRLNGLDGYSLIIEDDLNLATKESLKNSQLFEKVVDDRKSSDLVLSAQILEFKYLTVNYLYGLSGLVIIPQMLGAPVRKNLETIRINFTLTDSKTGKTLFNKTYAEEESIISSLYNLNQEKIRKGYERIYQKINNKLILDLELLFSENRYS